MKKNLFIAFCFLLFALSSRAQPFCGPYTHAAPIVLKNASNQTIHDLDITVGTSAGISLTNCNNIHITRCYIHSGSTVNGIGINAVGCSGITVDTCFFVSVATGCEMQNGVNNIVINNCHFLNMVGPYPRGQAVQFNNVSGSGNRITNNKSWGQPGLSNYEDHINVYKSNGTSGDPIQISGNEIYGGGPSTTGSGITIADQGGSYQTATNNIVVNSGNIGMQIAGGTFIVMTNNTIYSKPTTISHLGLGYGNYTNPHVASSNVTISNNTIQWRSGKTADLAFYPPGTLYVQKDTSHHYQNDINQVPIPTGWSSNHTNAAIDSTVISMPMWPSCNPLLPPAISYTSPAAYTYGVTITPVAPVSTGGLVASYSMAGLTAGLSLDPVTGIISGTPAAASATATYIVTATNASGSDTAHITLTINKAVLNITADNKNKNQGAINPPLTVSYSGFKFSDSPASLTTQATATTTALTGSPVGNYTITPAGAVSSKYSFVYHNGTLSVLAVTGYGIKGKKIRYSSHH